MNAKDIWKESKRLTKSKANNNLPYGFIIKPFGQRGLPLGQLLWIKLNLTLILEYHFT
jgi:hypothetical protein